MQEIFPILLVHFSGAGHFGQTKNIDSLILQNELLKQQNEIIKQTSSEIRNSYYWALGFTGTFLVLFLGINTFLFRNKVKEDKEFLNNYVENIILKETNILKDDNIKILNDIKEQNLIESNKLIDSLNIKINEAIKPVLASISLLKQTTLCLEIKVLDNDIEINKASEGYYTILMNSKRIIEIIISNKLTLHDWRIAHSLENIENVLKTEYKIDTHSL